MKKCPYCAEEIQDEAIKCRYCFSDLTAPRDVAMEQRPPEDAMKPVSPSSQTSPEPSATAGTSSPSESTNEPSSSAPSETAAAGAAAGAAQPTPWGSHPTPSTPTPSSAPSTPEPSPVTTPSAPAASTTAAAGSTTADQPTDTSIRYTHSGYRYVLGYGTDYFGIWDRQSPAVPTERFARTDDGWRQAWVRFTGLEPNAVEVPQSGTSAPGAGAGPGGAQPDSGDSAAVKYTHTGQRYILGYGRTFFGIWDRQSPALPVERFPRTDDGWAQAWRRYTQIEKHFSEVQG